MTMDGATHPSHSIPATSSENISTQGYLQYDGQHNAPSRDGGEGHNPMATPRPLQNTPLKSFSTAAMGTEQLHDYGTGK